MDFKDNFSKQSNAYQKYRPSYPKELFDYLSNVSKDHHLAWDCGTGNGQSAIGLTSHFEKVYATDPSEMQISNAVKHSKIIYKVEKAESSTLKAHSVDLITVAQALHWFDFEKFYTEAKRVLKPEGVIAAWTYGLPQISPEIDQVILHFHDDIVGPFWQKENMLVSQKYTSIPFPFTEIETPSFTIEKRISLEDLIGLFNSWSAVQHFKNKNGTDPIKEIEPELLKFWESKGIQKLTTWTIYMKVGKML